MSVLEKLLGWLGLGSRTSKSFSSKTDKIYNVFTKTKDQALSLDDQIQKEIGAKNEQISKLTLTVNELNSVSTRNKAIADKIDKFLNS